MTDLEQAIIAQTAGLGNAEQATIADLLAALDEAQAQVQDAADQHAKDDGSLPDGWWLPLLALLGGVTRTLYGVLRARLRRRLLIIAIAAPEDLADALAQAGDDRPLVPVPQDRLTGPAVMSFRGRDWSSYAGGVAPSWARKTAAGLRNARTKSDVAVTLDRARRLAHGALGVATVTGIHGVANRSRMLVAQGDPRFSGWRFAAVLDSKTTPLCRSLDGTVWKWNDPAAPVPPLHPNCRSIQVPV